MVDFWLVTAIVLVGIVLLLLTILVWNGMRYKHKLIVRKETNGRVDFIIEDKCRAYRDSSKNEWWRRRKEKDKILRDVPKPPQEALNITKKGKLFAEVVLTENGEYRYIVSNYEGNELNVFTSNQRMALVNQIKQAEARKNKDWKQDLPMYASFGFIVIIMLALLIFGPDLLTTYTKSTEQIAGYIEHAEEQRHQNMMKEMAQWEKIGQGIQTIQAEQARQAQQIASLSAKT